MELTPKEIEKLKLDFIKSMRDIAWMKFNKPSSNFQGLFTVKK